MRFAVRRLRPPELEAALDLCWMTFLEFEGPDYGPEGVETFRRDIVDNPRFHEDCRSGKNRMWGAFAKTDCAGERLAGVMVLRGESHVTLAFTHRSFQRRGAGSALFRALAADVRRRNPAAAITVNASPCGQPFYRRMGFADLGGERRQNGVRYTPMQYQLSNQNAISE